MTQPEKPASAPLRYPPVVGHTIIPSDRRDCRYACTCGMPLGHTRAESVRLHRAHKVNLYAGGGCDHRGKYVCERCGTRLVLLP